MKTRLFIGIIIVLCLGILGVDADLSVVPSGGTVFIGEEQIDISAAGIGPGSQIAWWAPGTSLDEVPADTVTISNPSRFSALRSSFSNREGTWYSLDEKTPVLKIKQPKLSVRISDTTSDFDATGKWLPRGHLASFQIETNLYEIGNRGTGGVPVDIFIKSPEGSEYSAVSGPEGSFSLTSIPVSSAFYDTGPVWNTGNTEIGTYQIRAECTANRLNDNNPDPGAAISQTVTVLIQGVNPLSSGGDKSLQIEVGETDTSSDTKVTISPSPSFPGPSPGQTLSLPQSPPVVATTPPVNQTTAPVQPAPSVTLTPEQPPALLSPTTTTAAPSHTGSPSVPFSGLIAVIAIIAVIFRISR